MITTRTLALGFISLLFLSILFMMMMMMMIVIIIIFIIIRHFESEQVLLQLFTNQYDCIEAGREIHLSCLR